MTVVPTYEYRATDPTGRSVLSTVEADSLYDATEQVRTMELELESIALVSASLSRPRRYEPAGDRPPPAPREVPDGVKGVAGHWVLMIVGGIFVGISSIVILVGLLLLISGTSGSLFMVLFPMIHFTVGAGLLYWAISRRAQRRQLYRDGELVMAKVDAVGFNRSVRVNGRNPFELAWTFDLNNDTFHNKRSSFNEAIPTFVAGDRIWVLYDPADPEDSVEWPPL